MAKIGSIYVALDVELGRMSKFRSAADMVDRNSRRMRTALGGTSRSVNQLRADMNRTTRIRIFGDSLRTLTRTNSEVERLRASLMAITALTGTGFTGALAGTYLLQTADRARLLGNQLTTVTDSSEELAAVQEKLYDLSQRSRSSFDATVKIYARTARATRHLGLEQEKLLRITETIQKAFAVGGASQQEAMGAAIQLSQGIASDRFSGEEYRSVSENAPVLLRGMADALGVNIGKLREMAHAGELTADVVTKAILGAGEAIDAQFDRTVATVAQSITRLDNAFLKYIGEADKAHGTTRQLSEGISALAENFESVGNAMGLLLISGAGIFGGRAVSGGAGGVMSRFSGMRQQAMENIDAIKKSQQALRDEGNLLRQNIQLQQAKHAQIVAAGHAAGVTAKQQHLANLAAEKSLNRINSLRKESIVNTRTLTVATQQLSIAQRTATRTATAMTMARNAGAGIVNFLGGPVGIAFTAAIVGASMMAGEMQKAAERSRRLKDELIELGYLAERFGDAADGVARSLDELADDEKRSKLREINAELQRIMEASNSFEFKLGPDLSELGDIERQLRLFDAYDKGPEAIQDISREMARMIGEFREGTLSAEDFQKRLDEISAHDLGADMDELVTATRAAVAEAAALAAHAADIETSLDEAVSRMQIISDSFERVGEANSLFEDRRAGGADFSAEQRRLAARTAEQERYEDTLADVRKAMEDYNEERENTILLTEAEIEALTRDQIAAEDAEEARQEALKASEKALEDAAKAAERYADHIASLALQVEAAPLSEFYRQVVSTAEGFDIADDEIRSFIQAVSSNDMASAPAMMRELADAMREVGVATLESEIALERTKLMMSEGERNIFERLSSAGIDYNSVLGQTIAEQLRFNQSIESSSDLFVTFFDNLRSNLSEGMTLWDALRDAALRALDSIASQMVNMAAQNLFGSLFGGLVGGGMNFTPGGINPATGLLPMFASGTNSAPGGLAIVGEEGPELVNLPRGSRVYDSATTMGMLGGGVTFKMPMSFYGVDADTADKIAQKFRDELNAKFVPAVKRVMNDPHNTSKAF